MINRTVLVVLMALAGFCWGVCQFFTAGPRSVAVNTTGNTTGNVNTDSGPSRFRLAALPGKRGFDVPVRLAAGELVPVPADQKENVRKVPEKISAPDSATPLTDRKMSGQQLIREAIEQELKELSAEEQEIWFELLKNDTLDEARNLLELRRNFGSAFNSSVLDLDSIKGPVRTKSTPLEENQQPVPSLFSAGQPTGKNVANVEEEQNPEASEELAGLRAVWSAARRMAFFNVEQSHFPGFKRLEFLSVNEANADKDQADKETLPNSKQPAGNYRVDLSQGQFLETGRALDLAIQGAGWFQVTHEKTGKTYYTRNGQFTLSEGGNLALRAGQELFVLEPALGIPPETEKIELNEAGLVKVDVKGVGTEIGQLQLVRFFNASALEYAGNGLYRATRFCGAAVVQTPVADSVVADSVTDADPVAESVQQGSARQNSVQQGVLELSNVDEEREIDLLERFYRQWKAGLRLLSEYPPVPALTD